MEEARLTDRDTEVTEAHFVSFSKVVLDKITYYMYYEALYMLYQYIYIYIYKEI